MEMGSVCSIFLSSSNYISAVMRMLCHFPYLFYIPECFPESQNRVGRRRISLSKPKKIFSFFLSGSVKLTVQNA